jgi:hypothetical protein
MDKVGHLSSVKQLGRARLNNPDAGTNRHARGDGIAADGVAREERLFDCGWLARDNTRMAQCWFPS